MRWTFDGRAIWWAVIGFLWGTSPRPATWWILGVILLLAFLDCFKPESR
jgi:hypothetical protein